MKIDDPDDFTDSTEFILLMIDTYQMLKEEEDLDEEQKDLLDKLTAFILVLGDSFSSTFDGTRVSSETHAAYYKLCEAADCGDKDARGKLEILRPYFLKAMSSKLKKSKN